MSGFLGGGTNQQTTTNQPWPPSQKYLKEGLQDARQLYRQGEGFNPYPGKRFVPFSSQTKSALTGMEDMARAGNPYFGQANRFAGGLMGGQYGSEMGDEFRGLLGQNPNAVDQYGRPIASGALKQTAVDQYGRPIASGDQGIGTEADYRGLLGAVDPEFENVVNKTLGDVGSQIQSQYGGASFGSGSNSDALTTGLGDVASKMRSENFYRNLGAKQGLLGDITGVQGTNIANQLGAAGMLSGEQGANIGNRLNAAGMLSGEQQTGFGNQRGVYGDLANLEQQDLINQMTGFGMVPSAWQNQFMPQERLADVGAQREAKAGEKLQGKMDKWDQSQMSDWDRLANYYGFATGGGAMGSTQQTTSPSNPWGQLLGGGLLASQMFGQGGMFGGGGGGGYSGGYY